MAFEVEFTLLPRQGGLRTWPAFSASGLFEVEDFALALVTACENQGLLVDQFQAEAGPGQFEIAISADEPLAAADRYVLLRQTIRRIAAAHGHDVSFAPAMAASEALGNGCHIHHSIWRGDENLFASGEGPLGLSREGEAAVAGLLERLYETTARSSAQASRATSGSSPATGAGPIRPGASTTARRRCDSRAGCGHAVRRAPTSS